MTLRQHEAKLAAASIGVGLATLAYIISEFGHLLTVHLVNVPLSLALRNSVTFAREIWIDTDFIYPRDTALAWVALALVCVGVVLAIDVGRRRGASA